MTNYSVTGKKWCWQASSAGAQLAQQLGVSELVGQVLAARQPDLDATAAFRFLAPELSHLPDPMHLIDMKPAVSRLATALQQGEKIAIWGDYDVDGACASALMLRYCRALGAAPLLCIPDRLTEGYGPNAAGMTQLHEQGVQLVVTVDCGSTADEALETAQELGMDVVVTDHHQCLPVLPPAVAVVNPNRVDETSPCTMLCGAGVAFYLLMALNRTLREQDFFKEKQEPDLRRWLDLVALATICDLVPLTGVNRVLVQRGLQVLNQRQNTGLAALAEVAACPAEMDAYHLGFQLGPRLNAGGRLAESDLGARLLSTEDAHEAAHIAQRLDRLNQERKEVQEAVLEAALTQAEPQAEETAIVVTGENWHPGVVGIVAARVKERFNRPTFVLAIGEDGTATGSGRSVSGVDLGQAVQACHAQLVRGGGHHMAAGVTVLKEKIPAFTEHLRAHISGQIDGQQDAFVPHIAIDGVLSPASVTARFLTELEKLKPYGSGHVEPTFALSGVILRDYRAVGADGRHAKLRLAGPDGTNLNAIAFGITGTPLGDFLHSRRGKAVSLCGVIRINTFGGRQEPDFHVHDAFEGNWAPN